MAPQGGAGARRGRQAVPPRNLQRNHQVCRHQGRRRAARHRHAARRRAAGAADTRQARRLQGLAASLEVHTVPQQPHAQRGARPVRGAAPPGRAPARDRRVQAGGLLPPRRRGEEAHARRRVVHRQAGALRRREARRFRPPVCRQHPPGPRRRAPRGNVHQGPAEDASRAASIHDLHAAAGGVERARDFPRQDDEASAVSLRAGAHNIHANGLRERERAGARGRKELHRVRIRRRVLPRKAELLQVQGRRPGCARGDTSDGGARDAREGRAGHPGAAPLRIDLDALHREPDVRREDHA